MQCMRRGDASQNLESTDLEGKPRMWDFHPIDPDDKSITLGDKG